MKSIWRDRRRAQSGQSLVEVLVSLVIASLALALIVGTLSSGLLQSTIAKRNAAVEAVLQYEMEAVSASSFSASAPAYSDCFATENPASPTQAGGYQAACPAGTFTLRADVSWQWLPSPPGTVQVWTIAMVAWPDDAAIGKSISIYKVNR